VAENGQMVPELRAPLILGRPPEWVVSTNSGFQIPRYFEGLMCGL
jgi:hypothetical protein